MKTDIEQRSSTNIVPSPPYFRAAALLVLLMAFFIRVSTLGLRSMWLDEGLNYWVAQSLLTNLLDNVREGLQHPPLFSLLLHFWMKLGNSEFVLRYLSLVFSVASVA